MPLCYAVRASKALIYAALRAPEIRKTRVYTFSLKPAFLLRNKSNQRSDEAMAVFRVEKNKGYTVMSNHHLRNKELSLEGKRLLSANALTSRRLGLHPCRAVPYQPGKYRRYPHCCMGA